MTKASLQRHFSVDARAILALGRDSMKDHTTAVLELVKNSYDAYANVVVVEILAASKKESDRFIRISDNGDGMSDSDVENKWLRIGYSEKLRKKKVRGRRRVGEKGVGRLSADRLGAVLELRSQEKSSSPVALKVDWEQFSKPGNELASIPIPNLDESTFHVPIISKFDKRNRAFLEPPDSKVNSKTNTGTELTIRQLRQRWSLLNVQELHRELSILTPPFGGVSDFQIRLKTDVAPSFCGVVESPFYDAAEIEAKFSLDGGNKISCSIRSRAEDGGFDRPKNSTFAWTDFVHRQNTQLGKDVPKFGPVSVTLLFYLRQTETLRGTTMTMGQLREHIENAEAAPTQAEGRIVSPAIRIGWMIFQ